MRLHVPFLQRRITLREISRIYLFISLCLFMTGCVIYKKEQVTSPPPMTETSAATTIEIEESDVAVSSYELQKELIEKIDARFKDPSFAHAYWGALIQSLESGEIWYERNTNKLFIPASNQKILTTAATLLELGPDFKFETFVRCDGEISSPTLKGNLVVFGNGDPTLYNKFFPDPRYVFRTWAAELRKRGISHITGDIIGDDNAFDDQLIGYGWSYNYLPVWYAAEIGPLQINENYIDVKIVPPETTTGTVEIIPNLPSSYYTIVPKIDVVSQGRNAISLDRAPNTNIIEISGTVVAGSRSFERSPTIHNPTLFYVTVLKEVLEEEGIQVDGAPVDCDDIEGWDYEPEDFHTLIIHYSPPLSEIIKGLMKRSQNLYAETMVRAIGWHATGQGSFRAGRDVVRDQLQRFGVAPESYAYMDGSGLTRYNYISPRLVVDILRGMWWHEYRSVWMDTLPIAGVDGTLRRRMRDTAAEGNVRAKTGTVSNVRALSGYVTTADGENLVFSFIVNAHLLSTRATELITDDVLAMLASFDRRVLSHADIQKSSD